MVRIPRNEQSVGFKSVDMPMSSGDGYQAPGKAMEQMGKAISGLAGPLSGLGEAFQAEQDKADGYRDDLKQLQFKNELDLANIKHEQEYQGEGNNYAAERAQVFQSLQEKYMGQMSPRGQQRFSLRSEAWRGEHNERSMRFEYGRKEQSLFTGTSAQINGEASKLTLRYGPVAWQQQAADGTIVPPKMEEVEAAVLEVNRSIEAMVARFPDPAKQDALRRQGADAMFKFLQTIPAEYRGQTTMRMLQQLEAMQPPGQPPGPASNISGEVQRWGGGTNPKEMKTYIPGNFNIRPSGDMSIIEAPGAKFRVSSGYVDRFAGLIADLNAEGVQVKGDQSGGYANRNIAGTNVRSRHAAGEAIDINWSENARGAKGSIAKQLGDDKIREIAARHGLKWGGDWSNRDDMHFEVDRNARPSVSYARMGVGAPGPAVAAAQAEAPPVSQRGLTRVAGLPSQTMTDAGPQGAGNDNRAPNTIPSADNSNTGNTGGQPQQVAQGSNVVPMRQPVAGQRTTGSHLAEKLREHLPALMAAENRAVAGLVKQVEDAAGKGFAHARLPEIEGKVKQTGDPRLVAQLEAAKQALAITVNLRKAPPAVITNVANEMRAQMAGKATPDQLAKLDIVEKLASNSSKALRDDPITWAFRANVVPEPGLLVPDAVIGALGRAQTDGERTAIEGAAVEGLKERLALAQTVEANYGSEFKFFTEPERAKWGELVKGGGQPLLAALGVVGQLGPENAARVINEIEDGVQTSKEMRAGAAHAAWLMAHNVNTQAAKDIATAIQMRADPQYKGSKLNRAETVIKFNEAMGTALYAFPNTERDALMNAAEAVFEVRNKAGTWDSKSADIYKGIVKELIGERTKGGVTYGGIIGNPWIGKNRPEIIPPSVSQAAWGSLLESISVADLKEAGLPVPVYNNGQPVPMMTAMNARLVNVGDGRYQISLGDPNIRGGEKWVMAGPSPVADTPEAKVKTGRVPAMPEGAASTAQIAPQREFVLEWKKLEPILRRRRPDAFY